MAKLIIDDREIEAPDGAPLVEVIKQAGIYISNLCYIDGLPPYAGCRTCLVEIEGQRGLQLACTTKVSDGMVVRTHTQQVKATRQAVLSLILSYHSDRCLTCHRVVKCKPGDTCLRDNVISHRCVTCAKNYRCELQTTCEKLEMAGYQPWMNEARTYYKTAQPEADRANPFLEFDPQMCIICTRCVRACDQIRHTGAITLAGRGYTTGIAFGAAGPIHESNCDFCGACIDVCPTATLMEHPNKWAATQTERWIPTTCTYCSIGCSIYLGVRKGRGVIVKPDRTGNPVSYNQLCVRGRFHYDAINHGERLGRPLIRRNGGPSARSGQGLEAATWEEALEFTAARLADTREKHGAAAVGFLGSPLATNEENYLLQKMARAVVGTNNVDSTAGPVAQAVSESLRRSLGSEVLPADMLQLAQSRTIVAIADDLESSHNVACLRIKDAVVNNGARLIVVSPRWGELCDFAQVWLRPRPGQEPAVLAELTRLLLTHREIRQRLEQAGVDGLSELATGEELAPPEQPRQMLASAAEFLFEAARDANWKPLSIVYAVPHLGAGEAGAQAAAAANLAIACCGRAAAQSLFVLPQEANVWGMRDVGLAPHLLPGYRPAAEEGSRRALERTWGAPIPSSPGLSFAEMMAAARQGRLKALVVMDDNPLFTAPDKGWLRECLSRLEFLAVIDSLASDTTQVAHVVLPDVGIFSKEGTITSADRRVLGLHAAVPPTGEARPAWRTLGDLGGRLAQRLNLGEVHLNYASPAEIMDEIADIVPLYKNARYLKMQSGAQQPLAGLGLPQVALQAVPRPKPPQGDGSLLTCGRSLYTSYDGAVIHSPEADKLHREEFVEINPADAARLGLADGAQVVVKNRRGELAIRARISEAPLPGVVYVPLYYNGGAVTALFGRDDGTAVPVQVVPAP